VARNSIDNREIRSLYAVMYVSQDRLIVIETHARRSSLRSFNY